MILNSNTVVTHISDTPIFFEIHMQKITGRYKNLHLNVKNITAKNV